MKDFEIPKNWKGVGDLKTAKLMIDYGILISWKETKALVKSLEDEDLGSLMRHIALRFAERTGSRLQEEILTETMLLILTQVYSEGLMNEFLEELLLHGNHYEACLMLTELAISTDLIDADNGEVIFAMAVAMVCELGMAIHQIEEQYPGEIEKSDSIKSHISTYLLSVSNSSNACIRLSLIRYFGQTEHGSSKKPGFNKIMGRFGHTVLENLFSQLFEKKSESVALQFLMENLPFVLEADNQTQSILHETFKHYMLKLPSGFSLFVNALAHHLRSQPPEQVVSASVCYLKHLGLLFKVSSDLSHRALGKELVAVITSFEGYQFYGELIQRIMDDQDIKPIFRDVLIRQANSNKKPPPAIPSEQQPLLKSHRRGRRQTSGHSKLMKPLDQVSFLGQLRGIAKAS